MPRHPITPETAAVDDAASLPLGSSPPAESAVAVSPDLDPDAPGPVEPGTIDDPKAYAAALKAGTLTEMDPDQPTCHYCDSPMVRHEGGLKDGCWHAANGCCFLPGRRELRPGHPPCDRYPVAQD